MGLGLLLKYPRFYFSFSIPRLFSQADNNFEYNNEGLNTYIALGLNKDLVSNIRFETNIFLRLNQGNKAVMDLNGILSFNDYIKLGANYRTNNTLSPLLKLKLNKLEIGYAYEFSLNTLIGLGLKTHEVYLKFNLENNNMGVVEEEPSE